MDEQWCGVVWSGRCTLNPIPIKPTVRLAALVERPTEDSPNTSIESNSRPSCDTTKDPPLLSRRTCTAQSDPAQPAAHSTASGTQHSQPMQRSRYHSVSATVSATTRSAHTSNPTREAPSSTAF